MPLAYFEVVATAKVAGGQFRMRHTPQERIVRREIAQDVVKAARGFEGPLGVRVEEKRQGPPKLHDLPSLQKFCSSRFGWPAAKTLEVAQELYDGQGKKIVTYPRAEVRYLPESLIKDVPRIVAGLRVGKSFSVIPVPEPPVIRKGASGTFYDKGLEGSSPLPRRCIRWSACSATSRPQWPGRRLPISLKRWSEAKWSRSRPSTVLPCNARADASVATRRPVRRCPSACRVCFIRRRR